MASSFPARVADEDSAALVARSGPLVDDGEPTIPPAEEGLSRGVSFVTGSPRGALLLFWAKGDGSVPRGAIAGSRHRAAVNALALSPSRRHQGSPRLLLSGDAAGAVMCWAVCSSTGTVVAPLGGVGSWETPPKRVERRRGVPAVGGVERNLAPRAIWKTTPRDTGDGEPLPEWLESYPDVRGLAWSPSGVLPRHHRTGSAWRVILEPEPEEGRTTTTTARRRVALKRASSTTRIRIRVRGVRSAAAPLNPDPPRPARLHARDDPGARFRADVRRVERLRAGRAPGPRVAGGRRTGASSGRVVIWNAKTRDAVTSFDAGGAVHCWRSPRTGTTSPRGSTAGSSRCSAS